MKVLGNSALVVSKLVSDEQRKIISLVVSRSLVSRLLGDVDVKRIEVWANVVWVLPVKGSPRFVSKARIWQAFRETRRASAHQLVVKPSPSQLALVVNPLKGSAYTLSLDSHGHIVCGCMDYERQREVLGASRSVCKHIFAYRIRQSS